MGLRAGALLNAWGPVAAWMALVFLFSTDAGSTVQTSGPLEAMLRWVMPGMPASSVPALVYALRKTAHVVEYAVLALLALRAMRMRGAGPSVVPWWAAARLAWIFSAVYAASDEWHQTLVRSRSASLHDVALDWLGAAAGLGLAYALSRTRRPEACARASQSEG